MTATPRKPRSRGARSSPDALVTLPRRAKAEDKRAAILAAIRATGIPPRAAALSVGVSSSAYYRLVDGDEQFRSDIESATALFGRRMAAVVARSAATLGSWRAAAWWLQTRMPEGFGQRLDLHVDNEPTEEDRLSTVMEPAEVQDRIERLALEALMRLSDERLDALLAQRRGAS